MFDYLLKKMGLARKERPLTAAAGDYLESRRAPSPSTTHLSADGFGRSIEALSGLSLFPRPIVVFDTETTGTSKRDGILEFAAIRLEPGVAPVSVSWLVRPDCPINPRAEAVHGISERMVRDSPSFVERLPEIRDVMDGAVPVAHNLAFDLRMLNQDLNRHGFQVKAGGVCTLKLARAVHPERSGRGAHTLGSLAGIHGISVGNAHRALDDVRVLVQILAAFSTSHPELVEHSFSAVPDFRIVRS